MTNKQMEELLATLKYPSLTKKQERAIWKRINEKLFAEALLEFKNEMVNVEEKIKVSLESHQQGMKGTTTYNTAYNWHQGYRDADQWILSLLHKAFARLGQKIMGIDPIGLPLGGANGFSKKK